VRPSLVQAAFHAGGVATGVIAGLAPQHVRLSMWGETSIACGHAQRQAASACACAMTRAHAPRTTQVQWGRCWRSTTLTSCGPPQLLKPASRAVAVIPQGYEQPCASCVTCHVYQMAQHSQGSPDRWKACSTWRKGCLLRRL
jgi:hypothetical protein